MPLLSHFISFASTIIYSGLSYRYIWELQKRQLCHGLYLAVQRSKLVQVDSVYLSEMTALQTPLAFQGFNNYDLTMPNVST